LQVTVQLQIQGLGLRPLAARPMQRVSTHRRPWHPEGMVFGVWGLGFRVWGLRFRVWGLVFGDWGLGFGVGGSGCRVTGLGFRV